MAEQIVHAAISNSAVGVGSLTLESCHQTFAQNFNRNINDGFSGSLVGSRWLFSDQSSGKKRGSSNGGSFVWSTRRQFGWGDTPMSTNATTRYTRSSSSSSTIATIQSLSELSSFTTSTVSVGHDYSQGGNLLPSVLPSKVQAHQAMIPSTQMQSIKRLHPNQII
jgi:hypothetical protein